MVGIRLKKRYRKRRKAEEISGIRPQRGSKKAEVFFPDEIMIDILRRLPAESAIRCRLVCRRWGDLASTHSFKELHMRHSIPMILVSRIQSRYRDFKANNFLIDKWWEPKRKSLLYHRFDLDKWSCRDYLGRFSHGGLVVFADSCRGEVIILNPTSNKNVNITLSKELLGRKTEIYGVFFHPVLREYCTLWCLYFRGKHYYKILNIGSKPCWRDISNPWSHRVKMEDKCPVLIRDNLYWLLKPNQKYGYCDHVDIMEFDIRSEKFGFMQCAVLSVDHCVRSPEVNLLDIDGNISFVLTSRNDNIVNVSIWKLKDGKQNLWVTMNRSIRVEDYPWSDEPPIATAIVGEMLLLSIGQRLCVCDMGLGTSRTFLNEGYSRVAIFSHVMSLTSLKDCKSNISMDKDGEVGRNQKPRSKGQRQQLKSR